jgi:hypothetical protein
MKEEVRRLGSWVQKELKDPEYRNLCLNIEKNSA